MSDRGAAGSRLTRLGRYEVLSELGKGAMGIVYLAKDPVIGRMVAIKTIRASNMGDDDSESREFRERFLREAQTAGILSHPNIVTIHDIGEDPETRVSFIAMEYIEGKNLKSLLMEKTRFSYDQVADMVAQVAEAIDYAHRKGIIHRDVKPANIIITADEKVKITDFGIAKIASSNLTTTGQFLGTPNYMSPEQVSGSPVDGRSDIFSLGVVLYELLTGRKPFAGDNLTAISYKIVHEDFTPPADLSSDVPPEFNPIVARAMAKDPWNRYQRGKDFALALQQLRAHMEEQKALQELGTVVSAPADAMATLKLTNVSQMAAEIREASQSGAARPATPAGGAQAASAVAAPAPPPAPSAAPMVPAATATAAPARPPGPAPSPPPPALPPTAKLKPAPGAASRPAPGFLAGFRAALQKAMASARGSLARTPLRSVAGRAIDAPRFWIIAGGAAAVLVLVVAGLLIARATASRPTVPFDASLARQNVEHRRMLEEGKSLLAAGKYEESAAALTKLLRVDPNNRQAKQLLETAQAGAAGRETEAKKGAEAQRIVQLAREAFAQNNYEEARTRAQEALALDAGNADAQKIRDDSATRIAEAEAEAKKKLARAVTPSARRAAAAGKSARPEKTVPTAVAAPVAPAPQAAGNPVLRLLFSSPISEGHIMVAINDEILLRKPFSFVRKEGLFKTIKGTGTVDASVPVKAGPVNVKVWLSGPDIPASILATTSAQMQAGNTRTLRLEYAGGRLTAKIQ